MQIRVRSRYRIGPFFSGAVFQVNRILFSTALSIAEDKPVRVNTFFLNEIVNDSVYTIPAELLSSLAGFTITDHRYLTVGVVAELSCSAGQQCLGILAQR